MLNLIVAQGSYTYLPYRQQVINRRHLCIPYCGKKTLFNKIAMTARAEITLLSNWGGFFFFGKSRGIIPEQKMW